MTVALDTAKGAEPQHVSFLVGDDGKAGEFQDFRHGYAGTVYKSQGRTLDELLVAHHKGMHNAAAYVALTRHREDIHIFASEETIRGMETKGERDSFVRAAAAVVLDDAAFNEVTKTHNLDIMARGFARPENTRAASAYAIDEHSALRLGFDEVAHEATAAEISAGPSESWSRRDERLVEAAKADPGSSKRAALQELSRLFGREIAEQEGAEIQLDGGGGQSR